MHAAQVLIVATVLAAFHNANGGGASGARNAALRRFIARNVDADLHDWDAHIAFDRAMRAALAA